MDSFFSSDLAGCLGSRAKRRSLIIIKEGRLDTTGNSVTTATITYVPLVNFKTSSQ